MADVDPWERQPGESAKAYAAFVAYRDAGATRSIRKTAAAVKRTRQLLERWSADWGWVHRTAAFDREEERLHRSEVADMRRKMAIRQARIAGALQAKLVERLQSIRPEDLTPQQVAHWLQVAAQVERQALGEPERVELSGPGGRPIETADVSPLTPEERMARLDQLRREAERRLTVDQPAEPATE